MGYVAEQNEINTEVQNNKYITIITKTEKTSVKTIDQYKTHTFLTRNVEKE